PERIWPVTWAAIIVASGTVLLLLWALVFRGGSPPRQQADKDQPLLAAAQSAESGDSAPRAQPLAPQNSETPTHFDLAGAPDAGFSDVAGETSQNTVTEPGLILDPVTLYAKSRIAVATISTKDSEDFDVGQGSGFFITREQVGQLAPRHFDTVERDAKAPRYGYFLTNYHVIRAAASAEILMEESGVQLHGWVGDVIMDREDLDLALLDVSLLPPTKPGVEDFFNSIDWAAAESKIPWWLSGIPTLEIAEGADPPVGTKVYTIGSPQGLDATLSEGIVSGYRAGSEPLPRLQFTAPVSPGSSGGPLLDSTSRVVGVVTALRRGGQNLNFAVPASEIRGFLKGRYNRRELWRTASIDKEADAALFSVLDALDRAEGRGENELVALKSLVKGGGQVLNAEMYREGLETLKRIEPSSCGDFEYLLHYSRGNASKAIAGDEILSGRTGPVPKSERNLSAQESFARQFQRNPHHQAGIRFLKQAIQLNPKFSPAYDSLRGAQSSSGQHAEALLTADKLVQLVPRCSYAYRSRGQAFKDLGQLSSALQDYQTAAELSPSNPSSYSSMGEIYSELGVHDKAVESYETAIGSGDESFFTRMGLGFALQKAERFAEAIVRFQEVREQLLASGSHNVGVDICEGAISECRARERP
ncbi:MAG: trypsin-like peptidase domain-containing protein, partial [Thermoguttaceae bacterium]